jgi:diacylglycerol kinase family enzyme
VRGTDLNLSLSALTDSILNRNVKSVDVAKVVYTSGARYFLNIADIGFGGKVVQVLDKQRRFIGGKASYALAILRSFLGYRRPELEITCENFQYRGSVLMVAICNGRIFGDGLTINPYAFMNDGKLNITLLGKVTLFDYIRNLSNLKSGKEIRHPEAHYLEASEISVRIINGEAVGELDGEYFPDGNCTFSILPSEIELLNY